MKFDVVTFLWPIRLFGQIRPEVEPRRRKNRSMRGPFSKGLLLQIGMQQQQTECILVSWIELSWLFAVRTDFTNLTVMLSDLLRNLTFNRSAHCTQVSDQCPLGLLFNKRDIGHLLCMLLVFVLSGQQMLLLWAIIDSRSWLQWQHLNAETCSHCT